MKSNIEWDCFDMAWNVIEYEATCSITHGVYIQEINRIPFICTYTANVFLLTSNEIKHNYNYLKGHFQLAYRLTLIQACL